MQLLPIVLEFKDGSKEPLDGDEIDDLCHIIKTKINLHEGNITEAEAAELLSVPSYYCEYYGNWYEGYMEGKGK